MHRTYTALWMGLALLIAGCIEQPPLPQAPEFEHTFGDENNEVAGSAQALPGGDFLIVGGSQNPQHGDYDLYILRIDAAGNEISSRTIGERNIDEIGWKIAPLSTGEFAIIGTSRATRGGQPDIVITLLNANLEMQWQTTNTFNFPNQGLLRSVNFYEMPDRHFIAGFGTNVRPVVMRFDERGRKVDESVFNGYAGSEFHHLFARDARGHFAMFVMPENFYSGITAFEVLHFDSLGNYAQTQTIPSGNLYYGQVLAVTGLRQGGYAALLRDLQDTGSGMGKVDSSTQTMGYTPFAGDELYANLLELNDGDLLVMGYEGSNNFYGSALEGDLEITLLDSSFQLLRRTSYGGDRQERLRDAALTPTGALLLGETSSYGAGGTDLYVVFLNN